MSDQYRSAASSLGGGMSGGLATAAIRQGELSKIAERIGALSKRAAELNSRLMATADRLLGNQPTCENACGTDCRVGEIGTIQDAIDDLENLLSGSENEALRISQL